MKRSPIPTIIGNEAAERFSFYGMRNILVAFLAGHMLLDLPEAQRGPEAREIFHTFMMGVYFFPLLGGWLADRLWGRYNVILRLSLVYVAGHILLAVAEHDKTWFLAGLGLIAVGSGGIKPCVSAFVGDQFTKDESHKARRVFDAFYWIINFGSFGATLLAPYLLKHYGPSVAFGVPGVLMALAAFIFWWGRDTYTKLPPGPGDDSAPHRVALRALRQSSAGTAWLAGSGLAAVAGLAMWPTFGPVPALCSAVVGALAVASVGTWRALDRATGLHEDDVIATRSVLKLMGLFALVTPFWSLFDQKASTWILQANDMTLPSFMSGASQIQSFNPFLVMILLPLHHTVTYPLLARLGIVLTALQKMTIGIVLSGTSWIAVGLIQLAIDGGATLSIGWQLLPYVLLTLGEGWVSATGLEFAYSQAPLQAKGTLMSLWSLSVTVGNLWVLIVDAVLKGPSADAAVASLGMSPSAFHMFFFAAFAFGAAIAFGAAARHFDVAIRYRKA